MHILKKHEGKPNSVWCLLKINILFLRQPPNLNKMICRAFPYQPKRWDRYKRSCQQSASGWKKFGKGSTTCCPFEHPPTKTVKGQVTGYIHTIKDSVSCQTTNYVYYWKCIKTICQDFLKFEYVGLTTRPWRNRLAEHTQYIKIRNIEKPSGYHFNHNGNNLSHFNEVVLEHVKSNDPFVEVYKVPQRAPIVGHNVKCTISILSDQCVVLSVKLIDQSLSNLFFCLINIQCWHLRLHKQYERYSDILINSQSNLTQLNSTEWRVIMIIGLFHPPHLSNF